MKHQLYLALLCGLTVSGAMAQSVVITDKDGLNHKFATDRIEEITFSLQQPAPPVTDLTFTSLTATPYDTGDGHVKLVFSDGNAELSLDVYGNVGATYLEPGSYTVGDAVAPYAVVGAESSFKADASASAQTLKSGSMTVASEDKTYTISFDITLSDDAVLKGTYTGEVEGYGPGQEPAVTVELADATACKQVDIRDPRPGEFYLRLNDSSYSYEMTLDIFADESATELPVGIYTFSETPEAGNFGPRTSIDFYAPNTLRGNYKVIGGTITVEVEADTDNVVIKLDGSLDGSGERVTATFSGEITYLQ